MTTIEADWRDALAGDDEAFGRVFDACSDRVYRHVIRLVPQRPDAEDVTATAFLELWRRRGSVRLVEGSPLPWLLVTATNVARNQARATLRYRRLLARLPRAEQVVDSPELGEIDPDLAHAIRALPMIDAQLLVLVVLEDIPIAEAAQVVGLTPGAAKVRLHRIRSRLRSVLGSLALRSPWPAQEES